MQKKIWAIISLSIIGVLIIATIIMANVKVNYQIVCAEPDTIYIGNRVATEEEYDNILNYINGASKESALTSLFGGRINDKAVITTNGSTNVSIPSSSNYYVYFEYKNPQKLMNGNKEYKDGDGNVYYYKRLVFSVDSSSEQFKVYIVPYYTSSGAENYEDVYSKYYLLTADFSDLYSYLSNL